MRRAVSVAAVVFGALWFGALTIVPANAHLVFQGVVMQSGTGLGAVPTILTLAAKNGQTTDESGKVSWNGHADVDTPDPTGVGGPLTGGAFTASGATKLNGINHTITLSSINWNSNEGLGIVFNPNEPGNSTALSVTLNQLVLTVYGATTGTPLFTAPWTGGPMTLQAIDSGTGKAGYLFTLDQTETDQLDNAGVKPADHVGLFAYVTDANGGHETFFASLIDAGTCDDCVINPTIGASEPASLAVFGVGLLGTLFFVRRRRNLS